MNGFHNHMNENGVRELAAKPSSRLCKALTGALAVHGGRAEGLRPARPEHPGAGAGGRPPLSVLRLRTAPSGRSLSLQVCADEDRRSYLLKTDLAAASSAISVFRRS
jgi:hypothetical protein